MLGIIIMVFTSLQKAFKLLLCVMAVRKCKEYCFIFLVCLCITSLYLLADRNIPTLPKTASLSSSMSVVTAKEESKNLKSSSIIRLKSVNIFLGAWILKPCVQDYEVKGIRQFYVLLELVGEETCLAGLRWGFHCVAYNMPELSLI